MEIFNKRLICFLDVLGFSNKLKTIPLTELHDKYKEFIDEAKNRTFYGNEGDKKRQNFASAQIFSDSIVLVSNEINDVYNVNNFVGAVHFIMEIGFVMNFPLRGAITLGDFINDEDRNIFLSDSFPEVVKYEGKQEWVGCVILEVAKEIIINSALGKNSLKDGIPIKGDYPFLKYRVPLKENKSEKLWCINFTFFIDKDIVEDIMEKLIEPKKSNFKKYYEYTLKLPYQEQILSKEFYPAKGVRILKTTSGMRASFIDENGKSCKPGVEQITWHAEGQWRD